MTNYLHVGECNPPLNPESIFSTRQETILFIPDIHSVKHFIRKATRTLGSSLGSWIPQQLSFDRLLQVDCIASFLQDDQLHRLPFYHILKDPRLVAFTQLTVMDAKPWKVAIRRW